MSEERRRIEEELERLKQGLPPGVVSAEMIEMTPGVWAGGDPAAPPPTSGVLMGDETPEQAELNRLNRLRDSLSQPQTFQGMMGGAGQQGGFQPSMSPEMMAQLYGAAVGAAQDPQALVTQYIQRMQYNDMLRNQARQQASQSRSGGFNQIVDNAGNVWFPFRDPQSGRTQLTPAINPDTQEQIKTDPRYSTFALGGGGVGAFPTRGGFGQPGGAQPVVLTDVPDVAGRESEAKRLERQAEARRNLLGVENAFAREGGAYDVVSSLIGHPARELMTGLSTVAGTPWSFVPGTEAQEFRTLESKLKSQAFINSIQELRATGATVGQITEAEGDKLQAAGLALNRAAQEGDYLAELQNFQLALARFMMVARQEAGYDPFASSIGEAGIDLSWIQQGAPGPGMQQDVFSEREQELLNRLDEMNGNP